MHSTGNRFQTKTEWTYSAASGITTEVDYGHDRANCLPSQNSLPSTKMLPKSMNSFINILKI